ncbi:MAG: ParB/RepB/Spo0J family partition protein [Desulfobacteraceae bacterium]|nr:ParB/RepB/Spo0J family partition protein [Desulfobacteraceae bacterium]
MSDTLCEINIRDIDLKDKRYKISFSDDDITFLAHTIKKAGLTILPVVRPVNNKFIIISGFTTIRALIHNNETKVIVCETKKGITDYQCLLKSILSLSIQRPLTHYELIICTRRLNQFIDKEQIAKKSGAIFNTELNARFVEDLLTIGALPESALKLINDSYLSIKSARRLTGFDKETIQSFLSFFSIIRASNNKQLEIILYVMEICARDDIKPTDFFNTKSLKDILYDKDKDSVLKTKEIRTWLYEKRFPTIFQTQQATLKKITSLKFGNQIKFIPPQNFESQQYTISFMAKSFKEFNKKAKMLTDESNTSMLKEIFNQ